LIVVSPCGLVVMVLSSWSCLHGPVIIAVVILAIVFVVISPAFIVAVIIGCRCHRCLYCCHLLSPSWQRSNGSAAMGAAMAEKVVAQQRQWRCSNGNGNGGAAMGVAVVLAAQQWQRSNGGGGVAMVVDRSHCRLP
jgi:hypothetical protein